MKIVPGDIFTIRNLKHQGDSKQRPATIVSPTSRNDYFDTVVVVPLTTNPTEAQFRPLVSGSGLKYSSRAECERLTTIRKQYLGDHIGTVDAESLSRIKEGIVHALELY
ncbi:MAG: type II toxin-antitoxin system PemK/MazF family toxin [Chloroflexaceae bacterium]|nr:type II toxin-antitoxin system PemK/MazF family toxin [Chloroflexaceae bacterium]